MPRDFLLVIAVFPAVPIKTPNTPDLVRYTSLGNAFGASPDSPSDWLGWEFGRRVLKFSLSIEEKKIPVIEVTIDNTDGALLESPYFTVGNFIEVTWGIPGNVRKSTLFEVQSMYGLEELVVKAAFYKPTGLYNVEKNVAGWAQNLAFGKYYIDDQIAEILDRNHVYDRVIEPTPDRPDWKGLRSLKKRIPPLQYGWTTTAMDYINWLAEKIGYQSYFDETGRFYFTFEKKWKKRFQFEYFSHSDSWYPSTGGSSDPARRILSFKLDEVDFATIPGIIIAEGVDTKNRKIEKVAAVDADDPDEALAKSGVGSGEQTGPDETPTKKPKPEKIDEKVNPSDDGTGEKKPKTMTWERLRRLGTSGTSKGDAKFDAVRAFKDAEDQTLSATVIVEGNPEYSLSSGIEIIGLPKFVDGITWDVRSAKHTWDGVYETELKLSTTGFRWFPGSERRRISSSVAEEKYWKEQLVVKYGIRPDVAERKMYQIFNRNGQIVFSRDPIPPRAQPKVEPEPIPQEDLPTGLLEGF